MASKKTSKTKLEQIAKYWSSRIYEGDLSIDFSEALERCWRCGYKSKLEKCHIVPHSLGGKDKASNYVLLCSLCHSEGPNVDDPNIFWDWLKAHKASFYDIYWTIRGSREYQFIYGKSIEEELTELNIAEEKVSQLLREKMDKGSWHFGQPRMNPATVAGIFRLMILELRKETI
jgi:hypothetical protein